MRAMSIHDHFLSHRCEASKLLLWDWMSLVDSLRLEQFPVPTLLPLSMTARLTMGQAKPKTIVDCYRRVSQRRFDSSWETLIMSREVTRHLRLIIYSIY